MPMVSGWTTGRVFARLALATSGNPTSNPVVSYDQVTMVYTNDGVNPFTVQLYETDDLASGPRTALGGAVALVVGGQVTAQVTPQAHFIEFKCTANGPSELRVQAPSQLTWTLQGFTKLDPLYPQYLMAGQYTTPLPTQTQITVSD
jgi:hypothetical protein